MSKNKDYTVHVQSSVFKELLETQKTAVGSLKTIEETMKTIKLEQAGQLLEQFKLEKESQDELKIVKESLKVEKESIKIQKDLLKKSTDTVKLLNDSSKAIANLANTIKTSRTPGEKIGDKLKSFKENWLTLGGLKTQFLKSTNVMGINNKALDKQAFIKSQKALGDTGSRKDLSARFEKAYDASKKSQDVEKEIAKFKKDTGLSEEKMKQFKPGKDLLAKRAAASEELSKHDLRAAALRGSKDKKEDVTPSQDHADAGRDEESQLEMEKNIGTQTELLTKIEENTRGASPDQKAKPADKEEKGGGGLLGGLMGGGGAGKAIKALKDFGIGIVLVAGALFVAAKAFQEFAEVAWEDVGKGLVALGGLVLAAIGLDKVKGSIIKGALAMGVLGLSLWGISAAFKEFADLEWETIGKGFAAIIGLGVVGVVLGAFAGPAALGAGALALLGGAVWLVGKGFQEMQEPFEAFIEGIEKLSNIGFQGLAGVAAGLALLGPAMALFAAGNVAAGLSNLVTGFLSAVTGQKSPVDQLVEIGKSGEGIGKAGTGMKDLAAGMKQFSEIKADQLKALKQFPWEEATKFVAAGGTMTANGATVANASKANADEAAKADGQKGGATTTVVNAPTTVNKKNEYISSPIRNQESSRSKYQESRLRYA